MFINNFPSILNIIKQYGVKIIFILILYIAAKILLRRLVNRIVKTATKDKDHQIKERAKTLGSVLVISGNIVIYIIIILTVLSLVGLDTKPILASAGVLGVAVGFGSQTLIKDFIMGLFILLENQYTIGEQVKIGAFEGRVEKITMRSTILTDKDGNLIYLSNSNIKDVVNYSRKK